MTETGKARKLAEVLFEAAWHKSQPRQIIRKMAEVLESELAAYGAAQYEAGATSVIERAEELLSGDMTPESFLAELRALPLREKEG